MKFLKTFPGVLEPKFVYPTIKLGITSNKKYSSIFSFELRLVLIWPTNERHLPLLLCVFISMKLALVSYAGDLVDLMRRGSFCPLPAAFCIGRKMNEKKTFLKYGIPGKLIFATHLLCSIIVSYFNFSTPRLKILSKIIGYSKFCLSKYCFFNLKSNHFTWFCSLLWLYSLPNIYS